MRSPTRIVGGSVEVFTAALKVPFITALGAKSATTNAAVTVRLACGARGYGEASGSVVRADLKAPRLARALRTELTRAAGKDARDWGRLAAGAWERRAAPAPAAAAFECALACALCAARGVRLADWLGGAADALETDLTISASPAAQARASARRAAGEGFRLLKVKVGTTPARDLARVLAAWDELAASRKPAILLDGNQGLTRGSAMRLVEACLKRGVRVALFEQPLRCSDLDGMAWLAKRLPVPIAADESARTPAEALAVLDRGAARVLNVKVAKTGLRASLEIAALARAAGAGLMLGCMQESARGLSASVHLACGTGAFDFVDLDSDHLLAAGPPGDFTRDGPILRLS